jgi:anti-anti-sigma factor
MEYTSKKILDVTLVNIQGRVDHSTAKDFQEALKPHLDQSSQGEQKKIIIDLGGVDFMTSAGLRVLMIAAKTCDKYKCEIAVAELQPGIQEIFKISRFDLILNVFPTVQAAIENLSPEAIEAYKTHH